MKNLDLKAIKAVLARIFKRLNPLARNSIMVISNKKLSGFIARAAALRMKMKLIRSKKNGVVFEAVSGKKTLAERTPDAALGVNAAESDPKTPITLELAPEAVNELEEMQGIDTYASRIAIADRYMKLAETEALGGLCSRYKNISLYTENTGLADKIASYILDNYGLVIDVFPYSSLNRFKKDFIEKYSFLIDIDAGTIHMRDRLISCMEDLRAPEKEEFLEAPENPAV